MTTIRHYQTGKLAKMVRLTIEHMHSLDRPLAETELGRQLLDHTGHLKPKLLNGAGASSLIDGAECCAVGDRICLCEYPDAPFTETVFLGDLARGMAEVGKARLVSKEEAKEALRRYPAFPIVASRVSGVRAEICRTHPQSCLYWQMERCGVACIERTIGKEDAT